ncbi:hypothetical protein DAEQUDRAFT_229545 [Daedalea quercina L-15889]|uniref:Uncharacterized protein n=1 Tax=Daedalea quercina L-15889 TaxID=1314783 RepID=A0A165KGV5_9APHY|nr:hypothetical protein DAEQUDRAFT_229545 [Daedalea quercina L-15889]
MHEGCHTGTSPPVACLGMLWARTGATEGSGGATSAERRSVQTHTISPPETTAHGAFGISWQRLRNSADSSFLSSSPLCRTCVVTLSLYFPRYSYYCSTSVRTVLSLCCCSCLAAVIVLITPLYPRCTTSIVSHREQSYL